MKQPLDARRPQCASLDSPNKKLAVAQLGVTQGTIFGGFVLFWDCSPKASLEKQRSRDVRTRKVHTMVWARKKNTKADERAAGRQARGGQKGQAIHSEFENQGHLEKLYTAFSLFSTHTVKIDAKPGLKSQP